MKKTVTFSLEQEWIDALKRLAESENRNLSNMIETLIMRAEQEKRQ